MKKKSFWVKFKLGSGRSITTEKPVSSLDELKAFLKARNLALTTPIASFWPA